MSSVNDAVNSITNLFESGDIRLVVDIALIAMVVWFVIRGVNRLFETLVLGGITVYAVYHILQYLGIEAEYLSIVEKISTLIKRYWNGGIQMEMNIKRLRNTCSRR